MTDTKRILALAAFLILLVSLPLAAGGSWVSSDDGESFDLKDLADGETRTFGSGDDEIRATRSGDTIRIEVPGDDDAKMIELQCGDDDDECRVHVHGHDGANVVMIRRDGHGDHKTVEVRRIVTGEGDHEVLVDVDEIVRSVTAAVGDIHVMAVGEGGGENVWITDEGENIVIEELAGPHGNLMFIGEPGEMVRCPEGDTTMRLDEADKDQSFYCPKHKVLMEKVDRPQVHRIEVKKKIVTEPGEEM